VRRGRVLAGLAVVATLAALALRGPESADRPAPGRPARAEPAGSDAGESPGGSPSREGGVGVARRSAVAPASTRPRRLPDSLRGTDVDGGLAVDAVGRFVPTPDALALFDYFFAARGEEPDAEIVGRIQREIRARLPASAVPDALALLDAYLVYRERARALAALPDAADLDERLAHLHALRVEIFGAALAETLFGDDEARVRAALERRRILADPGLDDAERVRQLEAVEASLPEAERAARAEAEAPLALWYEEARLRAAGGNAADVHALRAQRFGPEAAARLAALDAERAAWTARVDDYRAARAALLADAALAPDAKAAALAALVAERFTPPERLRVEALERIAAGASGPTP